MTDKEKLAVDLMNKVESIVDKNTETLITNADKQSPMVFDEITVNVDQLKEMLNLLDYQSLLFLPLFKLSQLSTILEPFFRTFNAIRDFKRNPSQSDKQQKDNIVQFFIRPHYRENPNNSGYFESNKEKIWSFVCQVKALKETQSNTEKGLDIKKFANELREVKESADRTFNDIKQILSSAQTELGKAGVEKHAHIFSDQANLHDINANEWRKWFVSLTISSIVLITGMFLVIFFAIEGLQEKIQLGIFTTVLVSFFSYIIVLCVKNYFAEKHNEAINKHKANCLSTFNTFIDASDAERKAAILLQATQTIFSHQSSGFLNKMGEISNPNPIIEVVRNIGNKN
jgi:hypothetical protein